MVRLQLAAFVAIVALAPPSASAQSYPAPGFAQFGARLTNGIDAP